MRGLNLDKYTKEEVAAIFLGIGSYPSLPLSPPPSLLDLSLLLLSLSLIVFRYFGEPVSQNGMGHILGHVKDLGNDPSNPLTRLYLCYFLPSSPSSSLSPLSPSLPPSPLTFKRYTTNAKHRFHTDSCDIVGLLCLRPALEGGTPPFPFYLFSSHLISSPLLLFINTFEKGISSISSSTTVYNEMLEKRPDLLEELVKPLCWDRKGTLFFFSSLPISLLQLPPLPPPRLLLHSF